MIKFILSLAFGITPLHVAAAMDNDSAIFDLVKNGAKVDAKTYWGATALHWAASTGADKAIRALINANADIGARNRYGNNAVHLAVIANKAIALCTFRIHGGQYFNAQNKRGSTPLHLACKYGRVIIAEILLDSEVSTIIPDRNEALAIEFIKENGPIHNSKELYSRLIKTTRDELQMAEG